MAGRKQEILKQMYKMLMEAESPLSATVLSDTFHLSVKSVYNYVNELQDFLSRTSLKIEKGFVLTGNRQEKERIWQTKFTNQEQGNRFGSILQRLVMEEETVSVRQLSEEYYVARSGIVTDLERVQQWLEGYRLTLLSDRKGTRISGAEQDLRTARFELCADRIRNENGGILAVNAIREKIWLLVGKETAVQAEDALNYLKEALNLEWDIQPGYPVLLLQMHLFLDRLKGNHFITSKSERPLVSQLHVISAWPVTQSLAAHMESRWGLSIPYRDCRWLNARIAGAYRENSINPAAGDEPVRILKEYIEETSLITGCSMQEDEELFRNLLLHFVPMYHRVLNRVTVANPYLRQIRQQYPALFSALSLSSAILEKRFGFLIPDNETGFLLVHFQTAIERKNLSRKLAVVTAMPDSVQALLVSRLRKLLPPFDITECVAAAQVNEDFDAVITTVPLDTRLPCLKISPITTPADEENIRHFSRSLLVRKPETDELKEAIPVRTDCRESTRKGVISWLAARLYEEGAVDEEFGMSMNERESLQSTAVSRGIAIPHGSCQHVLNDRAMIVLLPKPVLWGTEKVDLVFCLALKYADKSRSRALISEVYKIMENEAYLNQLRNKPV